METVFAILGSIIIVAAVFLLVAIVPVGVGKLLFRWSGRRVRYVLSQSLSTIVAMVVGSLILTGLILLVGIVFKQQWAFSGGLLLVYVFWIAIKTVRENIRNSKGM